MPHIFVHRGTIASMPESQVNPLLARMQDAEADLTGRSWALRANNRVLLAATKNCP